MHSSVQNRISTIHDFRADRYGSLLCRCSFRSECEPELAKMCSSIAADFLIINQSMRCSVEQATHKRIILQTVAGEAGCDGICERRPMLVGKLSKNAAARMQLN